MTSLSLPIVPVDLPGVGKMKVGRPAAQSFNVAHIDANRLIEEKARYSVSTILVQEGEAGLHGREAQAVERVLRMRAIIFLGGKAVTSPRVRKPLKNVDVVRIEVEHEELLCRVAKKSHRPLLREDPDGVLLRLREEREPYYREVETATLPSDDGPALEIAGRLLGLIDMYRSTIHVKGSVLYDTLITRGITAGAILEVLHPQATKVLLVHASPVEEVAQEIAESLRAQGLEVHLTSHPGGETVKSLNIVAGLRDLAGRTIFGRAGALVAISGKATTDMADFVAATWLRGTDLVTMPTTLLAMVDVAIGGKTGTNTTADKNLVGSFHPLRWVLCDLDFLSGLLERDFRAGMAEVLRCGFISDEKILTVVEEAEPGTLIDPASPELREFPERAIGVKARVVFEDLKESGLREILNYGHTLAHAIERRGDYTWRHGETVAVGCVFAAHLVQLRGLLSQEDVARHTRVLSKTGLPTSYEGAMLGGLKDVIASDKKARQGCMKFILLKGIARPKTFQAEPSELDEPAERIGIRS